MITNLIENVHKQKKTKCFKFRNGSPQKTYIK